MFPLFRLFTARKRSLGQGNIFTPVCHSVHGGGVCLSACWDTTTPPGSCTPQDHAPPWDHASPRDHTPPGTMHHPLGPCTPGTMHPLDHAPLPGTMHHPTPPPPPTGTHPTGMQSYFLLLASANKVGEKSFFTPVCDCVHNRWRFPGGSVLVDTGMHNPHGHIPPDLALSCVGVKILFKNIGCPYVQYSSINSFCESTTVLVSKS